MPAGLAAGAPPVLGQMGDGATFAIELLVGCVAPALGEVENHCAALADVRLDICDGPARAQADDGGPELVPGDLDAGCA
ncbi:hypothetical protein [Sorangium sp. So ce693]|uniref:hypothetical protein n=1 Tax=Sorangium sp. So ce693 TaxID=3133318 RepID=UPI003F5D7351